MKENQKIFEIYKDQKDFNQVPPSRSTFTSKQIDYNDRAKIWQPKKLKYINILEGKNQSLVIGMR